MVEKTIVQRAWQVSATPLSLAELNDALANGWMVAATAPLDPGHGALVILGKAMTEDERTEHRRRTEKVLETVSAKQGGG